MMQQGQHVFIIGLPGSGKTTTGKLLADAMQCPFVDTDEVIEAIEGKSVRDIFSLYGELYFRQLETDVLNNLTDKASVIATGGGMPCFGHNMAVMKTKGKVVYLHCEPEYIAKRLTPVAIKKRPLLSENSFVNLTQKLNEMLLSRSGWYEKADIIVDCQQNIQEVVNNIELCLRQI